MLQNAMMYHAAVKLPRESCDLPYSMIDVVLVQQQHTVYMQSHERSGAVPEAEEKHESYIFICFNRKGKASNSALTTRSY